MRWFDPITECWVDPPRPRVEPLTYADQQIIAANLRDDEKRKANAGRIWEAIVSSATASHIAVASVPQEGSCE